MPPSEGIFYPWVGVDLAHHFRALIVQPEHRFYGTSNPAGTAPFNHSALQLLTPQQALADAANLILSKQREYNCTAHGTANYCPVITIGGSYPGFLSAMMRLRYPAVVVMAYSASAPTLLYAQQVDHTAYYKKITESAERAVAGCPAAVRLAISSYYALGTKAATINGLGLCTGKSEMPRYLAQGDLSTLRLAVNMLLMYSFADLNMENYPPTADSKLTQACNVIVAQPTVEGLKGFLLGWAGTVAGPSDTCYNLSSQLPGGTKPTISGGDWSGVGTGANGLSWDYETCTLLVERIGTNNVTDMFPERESSLEWLEKHCKSRFGVVPQPHRLADLWGFGHLQDLTSRIIFTNGMNDGWSAGSVNANLSSTLIAINMPNGAHHSDLSHDPPGPNDTPDITAGRAQAVRLLSNWLDEIKSAGIR